MLTLDSYLFLFITGVRGPVTFIGHAADILISAVVPSDFDVDPVHFFFQQKVAACQGGMRDIDCIFPSPR